jgi:hypothetical protein
MQILDLRQAQIERTLGWHVSYLSRILSGTAELRFGHILDIGTAMGLKPAEVFRFAYPDWDEPPSDAGRRVREITASLVRSNVPAPPVSQPEAQSEARLTEEDVERMILKTMRRVIGEKLEEEPPHP